MKRFIKYLPLIIAGMLMGSCSDQTTEEPVKGEGVPEGMTQLSLLVPVYNSSQGWNDTRAFNPNEEGYMSNLYVVAVKYADLDDEGNVTKEYAKDEGVVYTYALNPVGLNIQVGKKDYHTFNVALFPGKYKFGVLANVDLYLSRAKKISEFRKESDLDNIVLYFEEGNPLVPYHLPMVCLPGEIQYSVETSKGVYSEPTPVSQEDNLVTLKRDETTRIIADMNFLCAKVRYTILFDKTSGGISEAFGNSWIRFNVDDQKRPYATGLRSWTRLIKDGEANVDSSGDFIMSLSGSSASEDTSTSEIPEGVATSEGYGQWNMSIDRYKWSEEGSNYPLSPDSRLTEWAETLEKWIESEQKVWQGIVYLPENLNTDIEKKTRLEFPYHTRQNSQDDTPEILAPNPKVIYLFGNRNETKYEGVDGGQYTEQPGSYEGLDRDYFYDVVAKVVNPEDEMSVQVFVSILPWHETDQNIEESLLGSSSAQADNDGD